MTLLKVVSLSITILVFVFVYRYAGAPGFRVRHLATLAMAFVLMGVPTTILLLWLATAGKWAGFFLICGLISAFALGSVGGYLVFDRRNHDPFHGAMIVGMWSMILAGTPLAIYLLP